MIRYKIEIAPKSNVGYASYIDVSEKINASGIGSITKSIDASDYSFGVFTFSDITLKAKNINGYFNINDSRSIFPYGRNKAKVKITFIEFDNSVTTSDTTKIVFDGVINDEATRLDIKTSMITFKVLSFDSVFRTTKVSAGSITDSTLVSAAIYSILNQSDITSLLTVSLSNINPDLDIAIDDGSTFDNNSVIDALNELLLISNSCLVIDSTNSVIVKSRDISNYDDALRLHGPSDVHRRENIIDIESYNDGYHRAFTSITFNRVNYTDIGYSTDFGFRNKNITASSITDDAKNLTIATRLNSEFKSPKIEMEVSVRTRIAKDYDLLNPVSVNYPLRIKPRSDKFLPVVGVAILGGTVTPLPQVFGSISISDSIAFKIIEMNHDVKTFVTTLKLRQSGFLIGDGTFYDSSILGYAILGNSLLVADADDYNLDFSPAILGGAIINGVSTI